MSRRTLVSAMVLLTVPAAAMAQSDTARSTLAKASQNPVSDLVSVPFQFNFFTGAGLGGQTLSILNVQPVLPLSIGEKWSLIARTIVPYVNAPALGDTRLTGVGDVLEQLFFTPVTKSKFVWGAGPLFSFPTATNAAVRTGDWGLGPAAVVVSMSDPFVLGALVTQTWTIAADDDGTEINQFTIQPFVNWNFAHGWSVSFSPTMTANWEADSKWTVPLGLGVTNITTLGRQPVSVGLSYFNNVVRPPGTGSSQLRLVTSFLFPKAAAK